MGSQYRQPVGKKQGLGQREGRRFKSFYSPSCTTTNLPTGLILSAPVGCVEMVDANLQKSSLECFLSSRPMGQGGSDQPRSVNGVRH